MSVSTDQINKYAHGVRGYVEINGEVLGVAQDISFDDAGDHDVANVMGSRHAQNTEIVNKIVTGRLKVLILDKGSLLTSLLTPKRIDDSVPAGAIVNATPVMDTSYGNSIADMIGTIPTFNIVFYNQLNLIISGTTPKFDQLETTIYNAKIKGKSYDYAKDKYWFTNVEFVATHVLENIVTEDPFTATA